MDRAVRPTKITLQQAKNMSLFRSSLLVIASGLSHQNILDLCFLHKDKISKQCTCRGHRGPEVATCPHHGGLNGVTVMEALLEKGVFSSIDTQPLTNMLEEVGRKDLANNFIEDYVKKITPPATTAAGTSFTTSPGINGE